MVSFQVIQGKTAGLTTQTGRFPFTVGRSPDDNLRMEDAGVWDHHLRITFRPEGYFFETPEAAPVLVNSERSSSGRLKNGDVLEFGGAKIQFWLAAARQPSLALREAMTWLVWAAVVAAQWWAMSRWLR